MKNYLDDLRGQVRGNHRLRNKIRRLEAELRSLRQATALLVYDCGDGRVPRKAVVDSAARLLGWTRKP